PQPLHQRLRAQPGLGAKHNALELQRHVVVGEPQAQPVGTRDRPGPRDCGRRAHSRSSTTGTCGTSPAWNEATDTAIRSVSNRTGPSTSNPAVPGASIIGARRSTTTPVAWSMS